MTTTMNTNLPLHRNISLSRSSRMDADTSAADAAADSLPPAQEFDEEETKAASKIQALARGQLVRKQQKDQRLWEAWNELDWKEEAELMASHASYESMKLQLKQKKAAAGLNSPTSPALDQNPYSNTFNSQPAAPLTPKPEKAALGAAATPPLDEKKTDQESKTNDLPLTPKPSASTSPATNGTPSASPKTYMIRTKTALKPKSAAELAADKKKEDDGLVLTDPIQLDFVTAMMDHFKFNKMLDLENVVEILRRVKAVLKVQPNVVHLNVTTRLTVVGDLHGQLDDLLAIFKLNGLPSPRNAYLFNGDFVDRGQYSCECVLTLFAFKLLYPKSMHLNRGNHEARDINSRDGFEKECIQKYNCATFDLFSDVFSCLPLAAVINHEILVVHGGLSNQDFTIEQLNAVDRFHEIPPGDSLMEDVMWSDPDKKLGRRSSPRGAGLSFGPDVTARFLEENKLRLIIRSHECMQRGFEMHHGDTLITVFSASNYCGTVNNEGSFIIFERDLIPRIVPFFAKPKERLSRYRMRHAVMENDIIAKLLQRIADNRLALTNWYRSVETVTSAGVRTVTRAQWAEGLKTVLKLNIPFMEFQDYLGLPKLGVDGKKKGDVDFQAFLLRFRPVNALLDNNHNNKAAEGGATPPTHGSPRGVSENVEAILEMLQKNRYELESLFRHFDLNGDESISVSEFKEGICSLQHILGFEFTGDDVDQLIQHIDKNGDKQISYAEFFSGFAIADPLLNEVQKKNQAAKSGTRFKSGSEIPPPNTPSPVITPRSLAEQKELKEKDDTPSPR